MRVFRSVVIASEAKQSRAPSTGASGPGLPRRYAPRNDAVIALVAVALLAMCFPWSAHASEPQTVVIDNFNFQPNVITVAPGTHIIFKNQDDLPHTVVVPGMKIKSPMMDTDGTYEATFDRPGDFKYFCGVHPMMTGEVIVKAE